MSGLRITALIAFAAALVLCGEAASAPSDEQLPEAPGKKVVLEVCTMCHDTSEILRSSKKSVNDWDMLILRMQSHGAEFTQEEELAVAAYLGKYFGPDAAPPPPAPPAAGPAKADPPA